MDCIFTKRELSWLDDLMPESKKKKLEDADEVLLLSGSSQHALSISFNFINIRMHLNWAFFNLQEEEEQSIVAEDDGVVQVPLEGYK